MQRMIGTIFVCSVIVISLTTHVGLAMTPEASIQPPTQIPGLKYSGGPFVILQQGDTTWVQPYPDATHCPGDPNLGHGGEGSGGPDGSETWCFEPGPGDTCGLVSPWTYLCFDHVDVRSLPSEAMGINYWHIDTYRCDESPYCGDYCLWCGSDSLWVDGNPAECGTWVNTPGYGNEWDCIVQLDLDESFSSTDGCTLFFDTRYDTECKFDYFYIEVFADSQWVKLATFNASSDNYIPGDECGFPLGGNPDYWDNTDTGQPNSAGWQTRSNPSVPAFAMAIHDSLVEETGPSFRWRFDSDAAYSDADGIIDTDGAAFIDNVWVFGDAYNVYVEDFEDGSWDTLALRGWSKPDPDPVAQGWHLFHDPDPPYEGGDGYDRDTCFVDSSMMWRARPEGGFPHSASWRNGWYYRLLSPKAAIPPGNAGSGCIVQYDRFFCAHTMTCDHMTTRVRFYDSDYGTWCPWLPAEPYCPSEWQGGCYFWELDKVDDVTDFYDSSADSVQFAWDFMDWSGPSDFCRGMHGDSECQIDNVSIGFFDGTATVFQARPIDLLHDTFHDSICAHNSHFAEHDEDTLAYYAGPPYVPELPWDKQLVVDVSDEDGISGVRLYGSVDDGQTWIWNSMTLKTPDDPSDSSLGGTYYETLCPDDFALSRWETGTTVWYYVRCEDDLANIEYFPSKANPSHPGHTGKTGDYLTFSILPLYPPTYTDPKILLVDGHQQDVYDWAPCLSTLDDEKPLGTMYEEILRDAGYCFDTFNIHGAGNNVHIHPAEFADWYDCVIWFTGPRLTQNLFDGYAQTAIANFLNDQNKAVICGDRIAYNMEVLGADSLNGMFLGTVLGCQYGGEMESAFDKPYVYVRAESAISVFGTPVIINPGHLDSLVLYRECPYARAMSYVTADTSYHAHYSAQPLLTVLNPDPAYIPAHAGVYVERGTESEKGQCVFLNFDISAMVNHETSYCDGSTPEPAPDFDPGVYDGRVELMRTILEEIFGLPSSGHGTGGRADIVPGETHRWALGQSTPNPCVTGAVIAFEVARTCEVSIKVYNARGQLIRTLMQQRMSAGRHSVHWDAANASGDRVSSGVYFYKMEAGDFTATRKMLVVN